MYYACMGSPLNWDSNNNGIMGDINSELNFNQDDIYISRCPARTKAQVKDFVDLVLTYEKNPPSLWGNKVLFCGQYVHYMTNHVSDVDTIGQIMIQESIKPYWNGKVDYLFDSRTNLSEFQESAGEGSGHISSNRVATLLNRNYSLVHEYTHGSHTTWEIGGGSFPFDLTVANSINSLYPKVILTEACHTSGFDWDESTNEPSLGEALMRNKMSKTAAYIGNSRQGFSGSKKDFDRLGRVNLFYSDVFCNGFINSLFNPLSLSDGHLGKLVYDGKQSIGINRQQDDTERWLNLQINPFGDPEMQLRTKEPHRFPANCVQPSLDDQGNYEINIHTGIDGYNITLYDWIMGEKECTLMENLPADYTIFGGDSTLLVLHGQNFIPLYIKVYPDKYIQDQNITTNKSFWGHRVYVGNAVTNLKPIGNVTITQGTTEIKAGKFINIQHGFEIKKGAALKMDIGPAY